MATKNDITGDSLVSKVSTEKFNKGYDGIDWTLPLGENNDGQSSGNSVSSGVLESPVGLDGDDEENSYVKQGALS